MKESTILTFAEKVKPAHSAVLAIDLQRDFFAPGGIIELMGDNPAPLRSMLPRLDAFLIQARKLTCPVVFTRQSYAPELRSSVVEEHQVRCGMKRAHRPDAEDFYGVKPTPSDIILRKNRYSAFVGTSLDMMLRANEIKTLIFTGVATNVCVESTARQAYMLDYYVVVLSDLTGGVNEEAHRTSLHNIDRYFGQVVDSAEVLAAWQVS